MHELRRSGRLQARLRVQIVGVDDAPSLRSCNVSVTGIFFETQHEVGDVGSMQRIKLQSFDGSQELETLTRIIRVIEVSDAWTEGDGRGLALEFMPQDAATADRIREMMRTLLARRNLKGDEALADYLYDREAKETPDFILEDISLQEMSLETPWKLGVGETIYLSIEAPASAKRARIQGQITETTPFRTGRDEERYHIKVDIHGPDQQLPSHAEVEVAGTTMDDALAVLLEETRRPKTAPPPLRGSLARIQLGSLLSFLEMERMSGLLTVTHAPHSVTISIDTGNVIDVEDRGEPSDDPVGFLGEVIHWEDGDFRFVTQPISAADRIGMPTRALLLQIAQAFDEASR